MALSDRIASKLGSSIIPVESGFIVNSYYAKDRAGAFVDIVQENGAWKKSLSKVPLLKIGGVSPSLPPVGSTAIIAYVDNNEQNPIVIGTLDSDISTMFVKDDRRPRKPPLSMTR